MLVVKTTSATVGLVVDVASSPRKRVPSSRRRNPGRTSSRVTIRLWLFRRRRRRCRAFLGPGGRRLARRLGRRRRRVRVGLRQSRNRGIRSASRWRGSGGARRWRREGLIEYRLWRTATRRGERKKERQAEEQSSAPPARLRQKIARLTGAEERARRATHAAERRCHSSALSCLHENGGDEQDTVENQEDEKQGVQHGVVTRGGEM